MAEVTVHIGTVKSGSTVIQDYLAANVAALRSSGWEFPTFIPTANHDCIPGALAHSANAGTSYYEGLDTASGQADMRELLAREFTAHVKPDQRWLLTAEGFSARLRDPGTIRHLKEFLGQWFDDVRVVVYFRRQDHMLVSLYSEVHKRYYPQRKFAGPFADTSTLDWAWVQEMTRRRWINHSIVFDNWREVFGAENLTARPYLERYKNSDTAIVDDFKATVGITGGTGWTSVAADATNLGLSATGIAFVKEAVRLGMPFFDDPDGNFVDQPEVQRIAAALRPFLVSPTRQPSDEWQLRASRINWPAFDDAVVATTPGPKLTPTAATFERVVDFFAPSNTEIAGASGSSADWREWLNQPVAAAGRTEPVNLSPAEFWSVLNQVSAAGAARNKSKRQPLRRRIARRFRPGA